MAETPSDPDAEGAEPARGGNMQGLMPGTKPAARAALGAALADGRYTAAIAEIIDPDLTNG